VKISELGLKGLLLIEPKVIRDDRGFFVERFRSDLFSKLEIRNLVQDNFSRSAFGVLRGLHFQNPPQGKLISVTRGRIFDVAVDIRKDSSTFGKSIHIELDGDHPAWFWMPHGFAHGFQVLSREGADVLYKVDTFYNPDSEHGIAWDSPDLDIPWPVKKVIVSARDKTQMSWRQATGQIASNELRPFKPA
jgi:dTDP-4-dehydrorhamnose 3,5-epimerase